MKSITLALTAAAFIALGLPAGAQTTAGERPPASITVTGEADVVHAPNQATVHFSIVTNDDVAARATSANNAAYNALVAKLAAAGVTPAQIKTSSYDVSFNQRPPTPNPEMAQRFGYVVARNVAVTTPQTDRVGALIDAAVAGGATSVGAVSFGLKNDRSVYNQALAAAIADADSQAHAMAAAAHVRIVRVLSIGTGTAEPSPRPGMQFARAAMSAPVPTDVQPSDLTVHASVSVRYQIASGGS